MNNITSKKIETLLGLKSNTLHYYIKSGAFVPEVDKGEGTGHTRLFSAKNFLEAAIIKRMIDAGYSKKIILKFFESIGNSKEWQGLKPGQIVKDRIIFIIIFYFSGDEIVHQFVKRKPKETGKSLVDISDEDFFNALSSPSRELNLNLTIKETTETELFSIINISAIMGRFFYIFDPKK